MKRIQKVLALSEEIIRNIISSHGEIVGESQRSLFTNCPSCGRSDKFAVLKANGACVCYRASCDFGRKWLDNWLAETLNISITQARHLIYGQKQSSIQEKISINFNDFMEVETKKIDFPVQIQWPEPGLFFIHHPMAEDAVLYLNSRGISLKTAQENKFMYNMLTRRLIMPIFINNICYGWQGRAIDKVEPKDRMRNNTGFRRDSLVMFYDSIIGAPYFIIAEGPFDALKFNLARHFVATLGKYITDKQFNLLAKTGASSVFLGLDDDASTETDILAKKFIGIGKKVYIMTVPESAKIRCAGLGKKADFGECTEQECLFAMQSAKLYNGMQLFVHIRETNGR